MLLHELIYINYTTVLIVLFMIMFLISNVSFEKRIVRMFMISILTALVLVIVDSVESYTETLAYPTMLRVLMSAIGYSVRPLSIFCVLLIITNKRGIHRLLLALPVIINTLISFSALFCDIAFSYTETNEFDRGPLGFTTYITGAIYLVLLCVETVKYIQQKDYYEALIVFGIAFINVISIYLEAVYKFAGFINASIAISVTFYYMYYHVQHFKRDALTRALNRRTFEVDVQRDGEEIKAMISMDLNYLKLMNDTKGHLEGDKALITVAKCVRDNLIAGCRFYRTGGDEFEILCFKDNTDKLDRMIENMRTSIERNSYSCAIGKAVRENDGSFETLSKRVDELMYADKKKIKESDKGIRIKKSACE